MASPFEAVGCGKFPFYNSVRGMSGEERSIVAEVAFATKNDKIGEQVATWLNSLTEEETKEYERLHEEDEAIKDEMYGYGCFCKGDAEKPRPSYCLRPDEEYGKHCLDCPLNKRDLESERRLRDFKENHGERICNDCVHYCSPIMGQCDVCYECKHPTQKACEHFHIETDDEMLQREHKGIYETDEDREKRKDGLGGKAYSKAFLRFQAVNLASSMAKELNTLGKMLHTMPGYFERMYAEFPEVFAKTNYKTFDVFKAACEAAIRNESK